MTDGQGSIIAVADPSGSVQERYVYTADGLPEALQPNTWQTYNGEPAVSLGAAYASQLGWNWFYKGQQWVQTQSDMTVNHELVHPWQGLYITPSGQWYNPTTATMLQPNLSAFSTAQNPYSDLSTYDQVMLGVLPLLTLAADAACFTPFVELAAPTALTLHSLGNAAGGGTWTQAIVMGGMQTGLNLLTAGAMKYLPAAATLIGRPFVAAGAACSIVSPIASGIVNAGLMGFTGAASGFAHGLIYKGWAAAGVEAETGFLTGAALGATLGMVQGTLDPFICFTAGTPVHSAAGKRAIETLRVGRRTLTECTKNLLDLPGDDPTEVDPATWRLVRLQTAKPAGSDNLVDVDLLRPLAWIKQTGAFIGSQIHFQLAELGIDGPADVLAIEPCPEIEPGRGRVITGTFTTARCHHLDLLLMGSNEVLHPTPSHRIFSLDRGDYIPAEEFQPGEGLRTRSGQAVAVESLRLNPEPARVYNLEVEGEHHYFVGAAGVLVHNQCHPLADAETSELGEQFRDEAAQLVSGRSKPASGQN